MKVLLLHGYMQNGTMIRDAMVSLLSKTQVKNRNMELIVPEGPFLVQDDPAPSKQKRGWWKLAHKDLFCKPHEYENVSMAIQQVETLVPNKQVDLIIGFSQGAVFATILISLGFKCNKVICLSGSDVMDTQYVPKHLLTVPSLHLVGVKDTLCIRDYSLLLMKRYQQAQLAEHHQGHVIPSGVKTRSILLEFIDANEQKGG
jgi:predicted esterase